MKTLISIIVVILAIGGGYFLLQSGGAEVDDDIEKNAVLEYQNEKFGLEFEYSENFFIAFEDGLDQEGLQYGIALYEDTPENRSFFENPPIGTEGPASVSITIFENDNDYNAESFVKENNFSNFGLSNGELQELEVGGEKALTYTADGLYLNRNVVVARPNFVYMFTAFYNSPEDANLIELENIIKSVEFE